MQNLYAKISAYDANRKSRLPTPILRNASIALEELHASGLLDRSLKSGDSIPDCELTDAAGQSAQLRDLLQQTSLLLTFYCGHWCEYCRLGLAAVQSMLPQIHRARAGVLAVSPDSPADIAATKRALNLEFTILSDSQNRLSEAFGVAFELPEALAAMYIAMGMSIPAGEGGKLTMPLPASFLIDKNGIIRYYHVVADPAQQLDPLQLIGALSLNSD